MNRYTTVAAAVALAITMGWHASAEAGWIKKMINNGKEFPNGIPNYAQSVFEPGSDDCGPVSVAMIAGYWDANGWPSLMQRSSAYTGGKTPSMAVDNAVERFKSELIYRKPGPGTPHYAGFGVWGWRAKKALESMDPSTSSWNYHDIFYVSYRGDIVSEVSADRPVNFQYFGFDLYGTLVRWGSRTGTPADVGVFLAHHIPAIGYEYEDVFLFPEEWMVLRSGWRSGGDSRIYIQFDGAIKTAFKVQPAGSAAADWHKSYVFNGGDYSRVDLETRTVDYYSGGYSHTIPWGWYGNLPAGFQSDIDAAVNAGAWGKVYLFKGNQYVRYDIANDTVDPGYPQTISQNWPLDSWFSSDIDAVATDGARLWFYKGSTYQSYDLATGSAGSTGGAGVTSPDAALNLGNQTIAYFKGTQVDGVWDITKNNWVPGYPKALASEFPNLAANMDAAFSLAHPFDKSGTVAVGEEVRYSFSVPANSSEVRVILSGDNDADLYTHLHNDPWGVNGEATTSQWHCRPYTSGSQEICTHTGVTAGTQVHVTVRGYAASSNFRVRATVTPASIP